MCDFAPKVFTSIQTLIRGQANLGGLSCHCEKRRPMLSAHIASFLKLIGVQLEETSRGIRSIHHFHNVECGIANILSLLEPNSEVVEKADQLSRKASSYIARHDLVSTVRDGDGDEDADRLDAARAALAGFRFAVEHSRPNSRVRTLGLA
jgi:hypothetical protein